MNKIKYTLVCFGLLAIACSKPAQQADTNTNNNSTTIPNSYNTETLMSKKTLGEALDYVKPIMKDSIKELDYGTIELIKWFNKNLTYRDVFLTSFDEVMKDPDKERGRRFCAYGRISQIYAKQLDDIKVYNGIIDSYDDPISFTAVKSTGDLVQGSRGFICGYVTGRYEHTNVNGGLTQSIHMVGIFDLPENKL